MCASFCSTHRRRDPAASSFLSAAAAANFAGRFLRQSRAQVHISGTCEKVCSLKFSLNCLLKRCTSYPAFIERRTGSVYATHSESCSRRVSRNTLQNNRRLQESSKRSFVGFTFCCSLRLCCAANARRPGKAEQAEKRATVGDRKAANVRCLIRLGRCSSAISRCLWKRWGTWDTLLSRSLMAGPFSKAGFCSL